MTDANYRKHNDRSQNSSTYHKKDGTATRAILKREAQKEAEMADHENETFIIDDQRENSADSQFVVFTDTFMSGWGGAANGRSLLAFAVASEDEAGNVLRAGGNRTDMMFGQFVPDFGTLRGSLREGDHLSIRGKEGCQRWYAPDGFAEVQDGN